MGLEEDSNKAFMFALAIFLHKGTAGMSLAISMRKKIDSDNMIIGMLACFASFTPLGLIIGMILGEASEIVEIVFSCLAAGTFIYIACSEVIIEEFSLPDYRCLKLVFFLLGVSSIACLHLLH